MIRRRRFASLPVTLSFALSPLLAAGAALAQVAPPAVPPDGVVSQPADGGSARPGSVGPGAVPGTPGTPGTPVAPPAAGDVDVLDKVLPELKFEGVRLEEVVEFLQDVSGGKFRAVVVHRGNTDGPLVSMRLKNVSIGQVMNVLTTAYGGIEVTPVDGPTGPVHVIAVGAPPGLGGFAGGPAGGGDAGAMVGGAAAEPERSVRVYRLAGIVESMARGPGWSQPADAKQTKEALNNILSLIKATVELTNPREGPTLQVHEETQTLIFKGMPQQRQALEDVLAALESSKAVRPDKLSDQARLLMNDAKAEVERAKADADRARKDADMAREIAMKQREATEAQLQEMNAALREREAVMARLQQELNVRKAAEGQGGSARDAQQERYRADIDAARVALEQALSKFGADHPNVRELKATIERLERMRAEEQEKKTTPAERP